MWPSGLAGSTEDRIGSVHCVYGRKQPIVAPDPETSHDGEAILRVILMILLILVAVQPVVDASLDDGVPAEKVPAITNGSLYSDEWFVGLPSRRVCVLRLCTRRSSLKREARGL